jgi:hypothetical protein
MRGGESLKECLKEPLEIEKEPKAESLQVGLVSRVLEKQITPVFS